MIKCELKYAYSFTLKMIDLHKLIILQGILVFNTMTFSTYSFCFNGIQLSVQYN